MPPMSDDLLVDRYRRVRSLGSGGMGDVWLADDLDLHRLVAVKRLRVEVAAHLDAELVERMLREARVVARLKHPAIVTMHDLIRVEGRPYLIMEYVEGESLAERTAREGPLSWAAVASVIADIAGALAEAHRAGIQHRDVKPANILLDTQQCGHLADFGIARGAEDAAITRAGELVGTVAYMPPEIARSQAVTTASDVWSLGATFFAAVEGAAPFADSAASVPALLVRLINEDAPPPRRAGPMTALLTRMLATDPTARPTAAEVAAEIPRLLASAALSNTPAEPTTVSVAGPPPFEPSTAPLDEPSPVRRRRSRLPLLFVMLLLIVAAGVGGAIVLLGDKDDAAAPGPSRSPDSSEPSSDPTKPAVQDGAVLKVHTFKIEPSGALTRFRLIVVDEVAYLELAVEKEGPKKFVVLKVVKLRDRFLEGATSIRLDSDQDYEDAPDNGGQGFVAWQNSEEDDYAEYFGFSVTGKGQLEIYEVE